MDAGVECSGVPQAVHTIANGATDALIAAIYSQPDMQQYIASRACSQTAVSDCEKPGLRLLAPHEACP